MVFIVSIHCLDYNAVNVLSHVYNYQPITPPIPFCFSNHYPNVEGSIYPLLAQALVKHVGLPTTIFSIGIPIFNIYYNPVFIVEVS